MKKVVTRIAPSPTGALHIGTARTALFNYLYTKKNDGKLIIRLEDTDKERSEKKHEKDILSSLDWLGIKADQVIRQTDRTEIYKKYIKQLIDKGHAYISKEPSKKDNTKEVEVVRFKNTRTIVSFTDTLRGEINNDISELGDFVLARSVEDPLFHLAVVIDDIDMGITNVIRGDDHITNTARHIALFEAFGANIPSFTHIPLIHSPSGGKLSKRKDATAISAFKEMGYLPEAMINFLALLGWSPKTNDEFFSINKLIELFSLDTLQKKEAIFDEKKLNWFQKHYVQKLSPAAVNKILIPSLRKRFGFVKMVTNPKSIQAIISITQEQGLPFSKETKAIEEGGYDMFFSEPEYDAKLLLPKQVKGYKEKKDIHKYLQKIHSLLSNVNGPWNEESIKNAVWDYSDKVGRALVLWPLRASLSGKDKSPSPFVIASTIGKDQTLKRIEKAIDSLESLIYG